MTRKDYQLIADTLIEQQEYLSPVDYINLVEGFIRSLQRYANFNAKMFETACHAGDQPWSQMIYYYTLQALYFGQHWYTM